MTTHNLLAVEATIDDPIYVKQSGDDIVTRHLGIFTEEDLSDWLALMLTSLVGPWRLGPSNWSSTTYQPKAGDGVSDGSGFLRMTAVDTPNSGWFSLTRLLDPPLVFGSDVAAGANANGKYLIIGLKWSIDSNTFLSDVGFVFPNHNEGQVKSLSFSLADSQKFLEYSLDDGTSATRTSSGNKPVADTVYWIRFNFSTDYVEATLYPSEADALAETNGDRTSKIDDVTIMTLYGLGFFHRGTGTTVDTLDIYKIYGTVCDWYGKNQTVSFDEIDFGETPKYINYSTFTDTSTGNVKYKIRTQETDGVYGDWSSAMAAAEIVKIRDSAPVYAIEFKPVFNESSGANAASLTSFSIDSSETDPGASAITPPTVAASDKEDGDGITITVSGTDDGTTTTVRYRIDGENSLTTHGTTISGDGSVDITGLSLNTWYEGDAYSAIGNNKSASTPWGPTRVTNGETASESVDIIDRVVAELNRVSFSQDFTAEKVFSGKVKTSELSELSVQVLGAKIESERAAHRLIQREIEVQVGIRKIVETDSEIAELIDLAEEIETALNGVKLGKFLALDTEIDPIYDAPSLQRDKVFISVVHVFFKWFIND